MIEHKKELTLLICQFFFIDFIAFLSLQRQY